MRLLAHAHTAHADASFILPFALQASFVSASVWNVRCVVRLMRRRRF